MSLIARLTAIDGTAKGLLLQPLYLQVPSLDEVTITAESDWTDYDALGGQFSIPGTQPRLKSIALRTLTVHDGDPSWVEYRAGSAMEIATTLESLLEDLCPFRVLLYFDSGAGDIGTLENMATTLRSLSKTSRWGESGTLYWDLGLTEWRRPLVRTRSTGRSRVPGVTLPATHKLKTGDTLRSLSNMYYGTPDGADAIKSRNGITRWGKDTRLVLYKGLNIGSPVTIPKVSMAALSGGATGDYMGPKVAS